MRKLEIIEVCQISVKKLEVIQVCQISESWSICQGKTLLECCYWDLLPAHDQEKRVLCINDQFKVLQSGNNAMHHSEIVYTIVFLTTCLHGNHDIEMQA